MNTQTLNTQEIRRRDNPAKLVSRKLKISYLYLTSKQREPSAPFASQLLYSFAVTENFFSQIIILISLKLVILLITTLETKFGKVNYPCHTNDTNLLRSHQKLALPLTSLPIILLFTFYERFQHKMASSPSEMPAIPPQTYLRPHSHSLPSLLTEMDHALQTAMHHLDSTHETHPRTTLLP